MQRYRAIATTECGSDFDCALLFAIVILCVHVVGVSNCNTNDSYINASVLHTAVNWLAERKVHELLPLGGAPVLSYRIAIIHGYWLADQHNQLHLPRHGQYHE